MENDLLEKFMNRSFSELFSSVIPLSQLQHFLHPVHVVKELEKVCTQQVLVVPS